MSTSAQRWCVYSGLWMLVIFLIGFWVVAGFIPPPSPQSSGPELVRLFSEDRTRIRAGMIVSVFAAAFLASWSAALTVQMLRMSRGNAVLAYANLALGALFVLEFIFSLVIWQSMTFRPRDPEILLAMNDTAWLLFTTITSTPVLQTAVIGAAILRDKHTRPLMPRWSGYLNLWVGLVFLSGTMTVFFHDGPFAWNGLFTWYVPVVVFGIWIITLSILMLRAIAREESEEATESDLDGVQLASMAPVPERINA